MGHILRATYQGYADGGDDVLLSAIQPAFVEQAFTCTYISRYTTTTTTSTTTTVLRLSIDFVRDYRGEPVPEG